MPSCKKLSARSRFTPLPGAALAIAVATRVYLPSEVQQELELGRPLAVYAQVSDRSHFTALPGAALAIAVATRVYLPSEVQQELELGQPLAVYAQLQEGVSSFAFYSLARACSGYCAGHQSVPAIRSAARTRARAATSGVCPVGRRCQFVRVLLP